MCQDERGVGARPKGRARKAMSTSDTLVIGDLLEAQIDAVEPAQPRTRRSDISSCCSGRRVVLALNVAMFASCFLVLWGLRGEGPPRSGSRSPC